MICAYYWADFDDALSLSCGIGLSETRKVLLDAKSVIIQYSVSDARRHPIFYLINQIFPSVTTTTCEPANPIHNVFDAEDQPATAKGCFTDSHQRRRRSQPTAIDHQTCSDGCRFPASRQSWRSNFTAQQRMGHSTTPEARPEACYRHATYEKKGTEQGSSKGIPRKASSTSGRIGGAHEANGRRGRSRTD